MRGKVYIKPRQSGKTTSLITKHIESNTDSCLIVINQQHKNMLLKKYERFFLTIYSIDEVIRKSLEYDFQKVKDAYKTLYIDEYLFYREKQKLHLYHIINYCNIDYVEIQTTADKLYNKFVIDLFRAIKSVKSGIHVLREDIQEEYEDYNYNLLTHPNFEVVTFDNWQKHLTKEQFDIEVNGKLYYDEGEF